MKKDHAYPESLPLEPFKTSSMNHQQPDAIALQFDAEFLHNFGPLDPIPIGAIAMCGAVSTRKAPGELDPLRVQCCPICVALTEEA